MTKQEVREAIYSGLAQRIDARWGFRLNKRMGAFVRRIDGGSQYLYVPLWDYNPLFKFAVTAGIRLDAVEDVFNRFSGAVGNAQSETLTSIAQLSYFTDGRVKDYSVTTSAEIEAAAAELAGIINTDIVPVLDAHRSVQSLDESINRGGRPGFDSTNPPSNAMHALILARLAGNPEYPQLAAQWSEALRTYPPFDRERFDRLVAYLNDESSP